MEIRIGYSKSKKTNLLQYTALCFGVVSIGFVGGFISNSVLYNLFSINYINAADAVSIANTYIVFTTIIFVCFTVLLAIAGIIYTHQVSITKNFHLQEIASEFLESIQNDDDKAVSFVKELLKNEEAKETILNAIRLKAEEITAEMCEQDNSNGVDSLKKMIDGGTF